MRWLRYILAGVTLLGVGTSTHLSFAQESNDTKAPPQILLVGFFGPNGLDPELRNKASAWLLNEPTEKFPRVQIQRPELLRTDQELRCIAADCLDKLAQRFSQADYLIGGAILQNGPAKPPIIRAWIFKANAGSLKLQDRQRWMDGFCTTEPCSDDQKLKNALLDAVKSMIPSAGSPPDVCPNQPGVQAELPAKHLKDGAGNCVLIDVCPNLADLQEKLPPNYVKDGAGNCVERPPADVCPNLDGVQPQPPPGYVKDSRGDCVAERRQASCWSFRRGMLLGASGGLVVSGLTESIGLHAGAMQPVDVVDRVDGNTKFKGFYHQVDSPWHTWASAGWVASVLGIAGGAVALAPRPWTATTSTDTCSVLAPTRWNGARGIATGAFLSLLSSSLVTAISLSANVSSYCYGDLMADGMTTGKDSYSRNDIQCNLTKQAGASWGFAGAWALGLTLTLALPAPSTGH